MAIISILIKMNKYKGTSLLYTTLWISVCSRRWRTLRELITGWICLPQEDKQTQPETQDRIFTWEAAISFSSSSCSVFSGDVMLQMHFWVLRKYLGRHQHSSLICNHCSYREKDLEKLRRLISPVLSQERLRNNQFIHGDQPMNQFLYCSLCRELLTLCSHRQCELTDFLGLNPARPTLLPLLRLTPGLSYHRWTRSHVLNPGLCLESPGTLSTNHTDAPLGPTQNSVWRASVRSFPDTCHISW